MVMLGALKNIFGLGEGNATERENDLVSALEQSVFVGDGCSNVVDSAARLRNLLRSQNMSLSHDEKIRIVKALNKAKVRALMHGTCECYGAFRSLDSISSDVVALL
jgi:hypothetical protein